MKLNWEEYNGLNDPEYTFQFLRIQIDLARTSFLKHKYEYF